MRCRLFWSERRWGSLWSPPVFNEPTTLRTEVEDLGIADPRAGEDLEGAKKTRSTNAAGDERELSGKETYLVSSSFETLIHFLPSFSETVPLAVTWAMELQTFLWKALLMSLSSM